MAPTSNPTSVFVSVEPQPRFDAKTEPPSGVMSSSAALLKAEKPAGSRGSVCTRVRLPSASITWVVTVLPISCST